MGSLFRCPVCTRRLLAGISHPLRRVPRAVGHHRAQQRLYVSPGRAGTVTPLWSDAVGEHQQTDVPQVSTSATSVPWYLQETATERKDVTVQERQRIPDTPDNSPPMLVPMLTHISEQLGLDHLALLDMRQLDPPAALGSNMIMVVGSARSEKHLTVSADRLCRWIRNTYKIKAFADGLLGRAEIRKKLRRRARKARILTAAGGTPKAEPDDGLTTGWICVNVNAVPSAVSETLPEPISGFIGFGSRERRTNIVVQMLTEDKRGELDLENFWREIIDRNARKRAHLMRDQVPLEGPIEIDVAESLSTPKSPPAISDTSLNKIGSQQVREIHTQAFSGLRSSPSRSYRSPFSTSRRFASTTSKPDATDAVSTLASLDAQQALLYLGDGEKDTASTDFLRLFFASQPNLQKHDDLLAIVKLQSFAMTMGHPYYTSDRLIDLLHQLVAIGHTIDRKTCMMAFHAVLGAHNYIADHKFEHRNVAKDARAIMSRSIASSKNVLSIMALQGHHVLTNDVFLGYLSAFVRPNFGHPNFSLLRDDLKLDPPISFDELDQAYHLKLRSDHLYKLRKSVYELYEPRQAANASGYDSTLFEIMLNAFMNLQEWDEVWGLWKTMPRMMLGRGPELYSALFEGAATMGTPRTMDIVLKDHAPLMGLENPQFPLIGNVAQSLERLVQAAKG